LSRFAAILRVSYPGERKRGWACVPQAKISLATLAMWALSGSQALTANGVLTSPTAAQTGALTLLETDSAGTSPEAVALTPCMEEI